MSTENSNNDSQPTPAPTPTATPTPAQTAVSPAAPTGAAPSPANLPPKAGFRKPGGKPIPDRWQKGGPPKADKAVPPELNARADFGAFKPNKRSLDESIEAEMNAAFAGQDLKALEENKQATAAATKSEDGRTKGRVVSIHGKDVFIEVPGRRSQGVMPLDEFEKRPTIGEEIEFLVDHYDSAQGLLILTKEGAVKQVTDWSSISFGMVVEAKITGMNKTNTGYTIEVNGIRGFMPLSQANMYRIEQPQTLVNSKLKVQVVELDPQERNLIVSHRAIQEIERKKKEVEFWANINEGDIRKGMVKSIKPFGAFVDLGGADGLIPIGELSWSRVGTVEEVLKVEQQVEVKIVRLDREARKIGLSLRAMTTSPWDTFASGHRPGLRLPGKVTRIMDFGAFVELTPGIEGLIHISELSTGRVGRVSDILKEGQEITVQIISFDVEQRRIALSLKAMTAEKEQAEAEAANATAVAEAAADKSEAEQRMANRKPSGNLRGGVGGGAVRFEIN